MPLSPAVKDFNNSGSSSIWGAPRSSVGSLFSERHSSQDSGTVRTGGATGTLKRVGLQGMTEASDGFMNMSIE